MGNCLALQNKVIKVMKPDGEVLEFRAPMKVAQVLSEYVNHSISDTLPVVRHLRRDTDMIGGRLYYLLPLDPLIIKKKKLSAEAGSGEASNGVLRIKVVMSKQDLEAMLRKDRGVSVGDLLSRLQENEKQKELEQQQQQLYLHGNSCQGYWKPALQSIPEVD